MRQTSLFARLSLLLQPDHPSRTERARHSKAPFCELFLQLLAKLHWAIKAGQTRHNADLVQFDRPCYGVGLRKSQTKVFIYVRLPWRISSSAIVNPFFAGGKKIDARSTLVSGDSAWNGTPGKVRRHSCQIEWVDLLWNGTSLGCYGKSKMSHVR